MPLAQHADHALGFDKTVETPYNHSNNGLGPEMNDTEDMEGEDDVVGRARCVDDANLNFL